MKFCVQTLGCKVNQFETQAIESILSERGHIPLLAGQGCDVCIINTCAVTAESVRKSRQAVRRMKKLEPDALIAVCGCLSQLEPSMVEQIGADLIGGSGGRREFALEIERLFQGSGNREQGTEVREQGTGIGKDANSLLLTPNSSLHSSPFTLNFEELPPGGVSGRTRALLKIQDGCDNFCAYCVIPYARGRARSLPPDRAAVQAALLDSLGFREIVVTGIEISAYGKDFHEDCPSDSPASRNSEFLLRTLCSEDVFSLPFELGAASVRLNSSRSASLLRLSEAKEMSPSPVLNNYNSELIYVLQKISASAPHARLRLGSLDPGAVTESFCRELSHIPNLCAHFHLSLQSGCDETLLRMGRKYDARGALDAIVSIRRSFPDCGITADLITGFPGETDAEFEQSLEFIKTAAFSGMHIFPFSPRSGTRAADMPDQIKKSDRLERARIATAVAAGMAQAFRASQVGKIVEVLFERERGGYQLGHSGNYLEVAVKTGGAGSLGQKSECSDFEAEFLPSKADFRRNTTGISRKYDEEPAEIPPKDGRLGLLSQAPRNTLCSVRITGIGENGVVIGEMFD